MTLVFPTISPQTLTRYKQECGGAGGVFDSLLDIVGQCTLSKAGNAPALLAGCGVADARAIRSNCCTLISLLSAILTVSNQALPGSAGALGGEGSHGEIRRNDTPATLFGAGTPLGGWDTFVPMNDKPSPDVVTLVRKKGWAARQQPLLPGSVAAAGGASSSKHRAHPGVYRGVDARRARRNPGDGDASRSPLRPAILENNFHKKSSRTEGPERSFPRKTGFVSPAKRRKEERGRGGFDANPSSAGRDHGSGRRLADQRNYVTDANGHARQGKFGHARVDAEAPQQSLQPMSECPASPPTLSRAKGSKASGQHASTTGSSSAGEVAQTPVPLGLSTPGHQRNKAAKVSKREGPAAKPSSIARGMPITYVYIRTAGVTLVAVSARLECTSMSSRLWFRNVSWRCWSHVESEPVSS